MVNPLWGSHSISIIFEHNGHTLVHFIYSKKTAEYNSSVQLLLGTKFLT